MIKSDEERILNIKVRYEDAIYGIMRYKEKLEDLKEAEKKLGEQYKEGNISREEYKVQVTAMGEAAKEYKENIRGLSKEVQNNIKQEKEQEGSLRALRAELSNATKEFDSLSRTEREGAKGKELKEHINEIANELKNAEMETQRFYRSVGSYEESIKNALGVNSQFASSLMSMYKSGGNIPGMLEQMKTAASAFGKTLLGLLTNPVFLALAGIVGVGVAFKWFYDYNKGVEEASRLTREFLGVTGDELKAVRSEIQATADMFDKDYKDVLKGVDSLVAQYGISAQEAMDVINDGFIAGADLSGDMLDKIEQYGPAFRDAGIKADEMVAIIAQTRSGLFSDKGLDLISMASKRIREMSNSTAESLDAIGISAKQVEADLVSGSKSTFDVIQEISAKLKELPQDSQEVGNVLKDVFGKQGAAGGLKMIESLDTMTTKIEDVKAVTGEYGKEQENLLNANADLNKKMSALFDTGEKGFTEMLLRVKTVTTEGIAKLVEYLIASINYFIDLYNESVVFRGAVEALGISFKNVWAVIKLVFNLIIDGFKSIGRSCKALFQIMEGMLTFDLDKMKSGFSGLMDGWVKTIKEGSTDVVNAGKEIAKGFVDGFNNTVKGAKVEKITIPEVSGTAGTDYKGGGGMSVSNAGKSGSGSKSDKNKTSDKQAADVKKKELEEIRKAEDLLMQLVEQTAEQKRKAIQVSYDRQIEDLKAKLEKEKNLSVTAQNAITSQMESLQELRDKALAEFDRKKLEEDIKREQEYIERRLNAVREGSDEEFQLKAKKIENERQLALSAIEQEVMTEEEKQRNIWAINEEYNQMYAELLDERTQMEMEAIQKRYEQKILEAEVENGPNGELEVLRLKMEQKQMMLESAQQLEGETIEEFNVRRLEMEKEYQDAKKALVDGEIRVEEGKMKAISSIYGGLSKVANAFADESKGLAQAAKVLALGEIAINTGVALAAGIKQAQSVPYPANLVAIATTVATVLSNIASAVSTVKSAKFAKGGLVSGEGTETSDSIPAMLSNGESVMTAAATRMFAPALSAFNQMGGGVPIMIQNNGSQMGEEFLASAVAKGMAMAPRPVVSVEEIREVDNRLDVLEDISTI